MNETRAERDKKKKKKTCTTIHVYHNSLWRFWPTPPHPPTPGARVSDGIRYETAFTTPRSIGAKGGFRPSITDSTNQPFDRLSPAGPVGGRMKSPSAAPPLHVDGNHPGPTRNLLGRNDYVSISPGGVSREIPRVRLGLLNLSGSASRAGITVLYGIRPNETRTHV